MVGSIKDLPVRLGIAALSIKTRFVLAVGIELIYMVLSRSIYHPDGMSFANIEIMRTPPRLVAALALWLLMSDVMFSRAVRLWPLRRPSIFVGLGLASVTPLLVGGYPMPMHDALIVALASVPVALNEEFFFRGILQTMLVKYLGVVGGFVATIVCFVLFHVGVLQPTFFNFAQAALMGLIVGIVYFKTGSMMSVILIHAVYDAIDSIPPLFNQPPQMWGLVTLLPAAVLFLRWGVRRDQIGKYEKALLGTAGAAQAE